MGVEWDKKLRNEELLIITGKIGKRWQKYEIRMRGKTSLGG